MSKRRKKVYDDDDGRVIADMSRVDMGRGMPGNPASSPSNGGQSGADSQPPIVYTRGEKRAVMR
ncbi:MAG: hypothetical protein IJC29_01740, partial [Clostridia bacterium]|nr:hypothetical protein [Clostridia bacterium]